MKCKHCKGRLPKNKPDLMFCDDTCKDKYYQTKITKQQNRQLSKKKATTDYLMSEVKQQADPRFWCTTHTNDFRCDVKHETNEHINTQFRLWKQFIRQDYKVLCNLILSNGSRPDLTCVGHGEIFIVEVKMSESDGSIEEKRKKYPWEIRMVVKATLDID